MAAALCAAASTLAAAAAGGGSGAEFIGTTFPIGTNDTNVPAAVAFIDGATGVMTPIADESQLGMVDGAAYNPHRGDLFLFADALAVRCNVPSQSCDFKNMMFVDTSKCNPGAGGSCVQAYQWSSKLQRVVALGLGFPWNPDNPVSHMAAIDVYHPRNLSGSVLVADVEPVKALSDLDIDMGIYMDATTFDDDASKYYTTLASAQQANGTLFEFDVATGEQRAIVLDRGLSAQFPLVSAGGSRLVAWRSDTNSFIVIDARTGAWQPLRMSQRLPGLPSMNSLVYDPSADAISIFCVGGHDAPNATLADGPAHHHRAGSGRPMYRQGGRSEAGRGGLGTFITDAWWVTVELKTGETTIVEPYHASRFIFHNNNS